VDPHLLDKLKSRLGSRYRIERELGGGGMSRVYLAEELELGRKVVLKVLPPELGAVLSAERFEREVRLAASLQHPHIVTLLASGSADGILYYTMPFVEGESLRSRLDRESELPVPDVVRMLIEIVDALGYAHAHGVIHRDIKPDNILMSHGHAVITDFGIARALSAADEKSRLTGSGISIGTPAYMAPEQAAAERDFDHRADLYSVGVLAYELLAGEPPFRGPTAQAVIAAHMTRTPPPVTDLRPSVPPELALILKRLLEKRPADRFQKTEELLAALVAVAGPGITTTRTAAIPAPGPRTWPLPHVVGYFAVAGAALLGAAWGVRTLLGLPDWFFAAAVVLLALGLPIVVAAALAHNRRVSGPASTGHQTPGGIQKRLTLRRAVTGGVAAFSTLGVVTAGYMAMRAFGIGPVGTLVASGKLNERDRVIIADFTNQTRDPLLGPAVTQAFRVDFAQSKLVSPVEADYLRRVLRLMKRPDSILVDLGTAREIAGRAGLIKAVIAGELQQVGPSILVSAQLVSADSGQVLATARATARDSTGILDAVDQVSRQLRNKIGESLRSLRANAPLAEVTTGSLEALRKYSQAIHTVDLGDNPRAIALLEDAVAIDSGFAMAWRKLGIMLSNEGTRGADAEKALTRAYQFRDRLTFRERKLTEDSYYSEVRSENDSAIVVLQSLLAEYPDDSWAWNNLGVSYEVGGNQDGAEQAYRRAGALEPQNILAWRNVFSVQLARGSFDSAKVTLDAINGRFPAGPRMDEFNVLFELGRRNYGVAETMLRALLPRWQTNPAAHDRELDLFAGVLALRGKLAESDRTLVALSELRLRRGAAPDALEAELRRVQPIALYRGDLRAARAQLDQALRAFPPDKMPPRDRPAAGLVQASAAVGNRELAVRFRDDFARSSGNVPGRIARFVGAMGSGLVLSMRDESLPQAVQAYLQSGLVCRACAEPPLAQAYDRLGKADSALAHYERWADAGEATWEGGVYFYWAPLAYFRMGELYEAKGDKVKAIDFYGRFTELWREADTDLQPRVKEAKRRITELQKSRG
jgi:tetratricopeptide (TPR) repeat protein/tRNA A-37 threonylcarbamoyl transferase component Bud32